MFTENFYDCLDKLTEVYEELKNENKILREELNSYNKDEEIQKCQMAVKDTISHSLFVMSDKEKKANAEFKNKHYKMCAEPLHNKAKGNTYIYELTGTGIGTVIKIKCPICGAEEDITDMDNW